MNSYLKTFLCFAGIAFIVTGVGLSQENTSNGDSTAQEESSLVDDVSSFVTSTSPAFLIILGIVLIVGSGFAKIIGYILIVYAIIRLLLSLL